MITPGTILMHKDAPHPPCFHLHDDPQPNPWPSIRHALTPRELEKELASTGWTFFYLAHTIRTTAFGFDRARIIDAALKRLIATVRLEKCNCLQIDEIETRSLLGVQSVSVSGHPRHIQRGDVFAGQ